MVLKPPPPLKLDHGWIITPILVCGCNYLIIHAFIPMQVLVLLILVSKRPPEVEWHPYDHRVQPGPPHWQPLLFSLTSGWGHPYDAISCHSSPWQHDNFVLSNFTTNNDRGRTHKSSLRSRFTYTIKSRIAMPPAWPSLTSIFSEP